MIGGLLISLLLCGCVIAVPTQDEVHFPIPDYTTHKWYSGTPIII